MENQHELWRELWKKAVGEENHEKRLEMTYEINYLLQEDEKTMAKNKRA
jgi:hypothetical protein